MGHAISNVINQGDKSIKYPGTSTSAFTDYDFYAECGKTAASGTIKKYGCAICALATYALYKGGISISNDNVFTAVKQTTIEATDNSADVDYTDFSIKIGTENISVSYESTSDIAAAVSDGDICFIRIKQGDKSHYVLVDGMDHSATGFDKYLVADPNGGKLRTLQDAFDLEGITASANHIVIKYILS